MFSADEARSEGLALAVDLWSDRDSAELDEAVERTARHFAAILRGHPVRLVLRPAPFTFEQGSNIPRPTILTGGAMSVTMTDAQEVTYACEPEDSKGFEVSDTLTWSESSGGAVVTAAPSADGLSCVLTAVAPGTSTVSVTDGSLSAQDLITVTPGSVASLVLTPGTPEDVAAAAPPSAPTA